LVKKTSFIVLFNYTLKKEYLNWRFGVDTKKEVLEIPFVSTERNYWLVRTEGGKYYKSFFTNGYIAISWNELGEDIFNNTSEEKPLSRDRVFKFYEDKYKNDEIKLKYYSRRSSGIANTLNRFKYGIKTGDIVMIPSTNSDEISFGEVMEDDDLYFEKEFPVKQPKEHTDEKYCPFIKRKKVKWLKSVERKKLEPKLFASFHSHHTISALNKEVYGNYIDRTIDSIYIKGETAHLVLEVEKESDINALVFANLIKDSVLAVDSLNNPSNKNEISGRNIKIKANVQSPGPMEFFGPIAEILILTVVIKKTFDSGAITFKFGKKKDSNVDRILEELEKKEFEKYKEMIESGRSNTDSIRVSLEELVVGDPTQQINSN
jgi:restriction system protein